MTAHLPGPNTWFYEVRFMDCGCWKPTAGRVQIKVGDEIWCFIHQRMAKIINTEPATLAEQDALCREGEAIA